MELLVSEIIKQESYDWDYDYGALPTTKKAWTVAKILLKNIYEDESISFSVKQEFLYRIHYNRIDLNETKEEIIDFIECYGERIYRDDFNIEDFDNINDALKYFNSLH